MTTIAYRNGVMASDSRAYAGNRLSIGSKQKIRRLKDGTLIGCSSTHVGGAKWVLDWYEDGCPAQPGKEVLLPESFNLLVAVPSGEVFYAKDIGVLTGPLTGAFFAIGSGEDVALGAMAYSELCNAVEAVRIACLYDVWSDLPIYAASHDGPMPVLETRLPPDQLIWINKETA